MVDWTFFVGVGGDKEYRSILQLWVGKAIQYLKLNELLWKFGK